MWLWRTGLPRGLGAAVCWQPGAAAAGRWGLLAGGDPCSFLVVCAPLCSWPAAYSGKPAQRSCRRYCAVQVPFSYIWSEAVVPRPPDWQPWVDVVGAYC